MRDSMTWAQQEQACDMVSMFYWLYCAGTWELIEIFGTHGLDDNDCLPPIAIIYRNASSVRSLHV
jgi:hypothetical protein